MDMGNTQRVKNLSCICLTHGQGSASVRENPVGWGLGGGGRGVDGDAGGAKG